MYICTDRLLEIFLDLVKINAISKQEKPVADYIQNFLREKNIISREDGTGEIIGGNSGNIISKIYYKEQFDPIQFSFVTHMDTVKPTKGISPQIEAERIKTDGKTILGADNRAGIAIILYLVENLKRNNIPHRPFEIIFTVGEETGLYGSANLDLNLIESRTAYILDSSADPGYFVYTAPGAIDFKIDFIGKPSHAAVNPEQGVNALKMACDLIYHFHIGKVNNDTTINFGKISGGEANNIVPAQIHLTGEIRSFHKDKINKYYKELSEILSTLEQKFGGRIVIKKEEAFPGFILDRDCQAVHQLSNCLKVVGLKPQPIPYHGGSDANMLNNRGVTAIDLGIGAKNPHSTEEYIEISDLVLIEQLLHQMVAIT